MTQDQIIEFAQEATRYANDQTDAEGYNWDLIRDERFANLVAQYEREQCVQVLDQNRALCQPNGTLDMVLHACASAIRQRGESSNGKG